MNKATNKNGNQNLKPITCLFLGSGASTVLAGAETQAGFLKSVLDHRCDWIDNCGIRINGTKLSEWMLTIGDIEICMSHLHNIAYSNLATSTSRPQAKKAIINLRAAMADYLKDKEPQGDAPKKFLTWLNNMKNPENPPVVLTTNYDLVIEKLLENGNYEYPDIPLKMPPHNDKVIPIYKLHGSINWMEERRFDGKELVGIDPVKIDDKLPLNTPEERNGYRIFANKEGIYTPILIPFFYQKEDWVSQRWRCIFQTHWASALRYLSDNKLEQIYFIGYGLPPADHYMLSWLLNILNNDNARNVKITIVGKDTDKPTLLRRIVQHFPCRREESNVDKSTLLEKTLDPFLKLDNVYKCGLENFLDDHV